MAVDPSMGPPPFSDGNLLNRPRPPTGWTSLQWGHRLSAMETGLCQLFRGVAVRPSMGPPPFSDGNRAMPAFQGSCSTTFNGATAFQRWKHAESPWELVALTRLQWGHRLSAMETFVPRVGLWCLPNLQWGHRLSAMETSLKAYSPGWTVFLQWGHRLSAMETALCGSSPSWIHEKAVFSTRIGYRINGRASVAQLGFATP